MSSSAPIPALIPETMPSRLRTFWDSVAPWVRPVTSVIFFVVALGLLHYEFKSIKATEVANSFRQIPISSVLLAVLITVCNYVVLIGYDWFGLRLIHQRLSHKQIVIASLLSYAFSNSLGVIFGGTPVRVRLYSSWGVKPPELVRLLVFIGLAFWMGLLTLGSLLFIIAPFDLPSRFNLPLTTSRPLGVLMTLPVVAFFAASALWRRPISVFNVNIQPPPLKIAVAQTLVAMLDFLLSAGVLYVLLPVDEAIAFLPFVAIFLLAIIIALISHVPGGLGVLELVLVTMLPQSSHGLVASLLAFRVIYYLLPLLMAVFAVAVSTVRAHSTQAKNLVATTARWTSIISPRIITGAVFVAGLLLLISGSLPAAEGRMQFIHRSMPLPVVELSHFVGSIVGVLLLVLARGLQRRIDAAWGLTITLLGIGAILSLVKGFDYEEAIILTLLLFALLPCREYFYRQGTLLDPSLKLGWLTAVLMSFGLLVWLILFSYRHVEYSNDLWWDFAYRGDAPRSLRALLGAAVTLLVIGVTRLLQPRPGFPEVADPHQLDEVAAIVEFAESTSAQLALLGDKRFIFSEDRKAFVMFGCENNSWITMGDPIGPDRSADDAAWMFREACDAAGTRPVFYQVDESSLGRYIEMGMSMLKLGEEARVPLTDFSLDGSSRKDLRRTKKKAAEAGLHFMIIGQADVTAWMPKLKQISDAWLADKPTGEKGFSLGYFDPSYLSRFDIAVIFQDCDPNTPTTASPATARPEMAHPVTAHPVTAHDDGVSADRVIAFANIWRGVNKQELSIDLMRYIPDAPHGVMEFMFVELMQYGQEQGYQWFNLGMAPLSGVESHRLGPLWNRVSNILFLHGEHFYNFQGLRAYKEKFDPEWFPKYLASPGGLATPRVLADVSTLISGGVGRLLHH